MLRTKAIAFSIAAVFAALSTAGAVQTTLYISEYSEGDSALGQGSDKYIEIYNATDATVAMTNYRVWRITNGGIWPSLAISLSGTLATGDVYVVCHTDAAAPIQAKADLVTGSMSQNGNDAIGLARRDGGPYLGWSLIDAVGEEVPDPGPEVGWDVAGVSNATKDHVLIRKLGIHRGNTNWSLSAGTDASNSEWRVEASGFYANLGGVGEDQFLPELAFSATEAVDNFVPGDTEIYALVNGTVDMDATATDVNADLTSLGCLNPPPGSVLTGNPVVGIPPLTNNFAWTPTVLGDYAVNFYATDDEGTVNGSVNVHVWPTVNGPGALWINEIHYDNTSTDTNEGVEIAGPAHTDLTGYKLVAYNGTDGEEYKTVTISGVTIDDEGPAYGAVWIPVSGLQNGPRDGIALIDNVGGVRQFISYEGIVAAVDDLAQGKMSKDIGVSEGTGASPEESLQLTGSGTTYGAFTWGGPVPRSPGELNNGQSVPLNATFLRFK